MDNNEKKTLLLKNQSILLHQIKRSRKLVLAQLTSGLLFFLAFLISFYLRFVLRPNSFPLALFLTLCLFLILLLWRDLLFIRLFKLNTESLMRIEALSDDSSPHIGLLSFINEVLWFLHPLKSKPSYEPSKAQYIEKRMRNELNRHIILNIVVILNYLLTILELGFYNGNPTNLSLIHSIWLLIIFLSFVRSFFFLYWRNITSKWVLASKEIDNWGRDLEERMKARLNNTRDNI